MPLFMNMQCGRADQFFLSFLFRFCDVKKYLQSVLSAEDLIKNKLENVLNVADRVTADMFVRLEERRIMLETDVQVLELINENMDLFSKCVQYSTVQYIVLQLF